MAEGSFNALPEDALVDSASGPDSVWDRLMPSDYLDIISCSIDGRDSLLARFHSKKDLYLHLCDHPILIDGGRKSFSLEKWSGKKCYVLAARELRIVWGERPQYWQWISHPESRFAEVAELLNVSWFQIDGKISVKMLSPNTNYAAYLVFKCRARLYGFHDQIVKGNVGSVGQKSQTVMICLDESVAIEGVTEYPKQRDDGWMEVELGEYFVKGEGEEGDLETTLSETSLYWKRGLIIQGIEIRPKYQN